MSEFRLLVGDCRDMLRTLPDESVHCVVTSPPYWGLRDYGHDGQLGLEPTPEEYVANMVDVFHEARRVLRDDGTLWLNLGDSYATQGVPAGLKPKDLVGIPWRVALALQADGWYLRMDNVWSKPNAMPESVQDRPTKAHEYVFLLSKSERYYYDADAIKESAVSDHPSGNGFKRDARLSYRDKDGARGNEAQWDNVGGSRNARSVWTIEATGNRERECLSIIESDLSPQDKLDAIKAMMGGRQTSVWQIATKPYPGAHFATFPPELAERCILAGCPKGGTVLDPFGGSGTVGMVATGNGRSAILIELNPAYAELARERIGPMFERAAA